MKALLVSDHAFPDGSAGAVREEIFARIIQNRGYEVTHIGAGNKQPAISQHNGVEVYNLGSINKGLRGRIENYLLFDLRVKKLFKQLITKNQYDIILLTDLHIGLTKFFERYKKQYSNCSLIYNVVEWYSPEHHKLGKFSLSYQNNNLTNSVVINKNYKVIAISSYLKEYFSNKGIETCRIPFVLDSKDFKPLFSVNKKRVFAYIGRPSNNKDHLGEIVNGFSMLADSELENIEIHLVGITEDDLKKVFAVSYAILNRLKGSLHIHGVLPRNEALKILRNADFTVLLRSPYQRYAKAGFPTKVCESMMYGIPVVSNLTSDLALYIKDGVNGIAVNEDSAESFCYSLSRAIRLQNDEIIKMKKEARKTAEQYLDYSTYIQDLSGFFR